MWLIFYRLFLTAVVMQNARNGRFTGITGKYRFKFDMLVTNHLGESTMEKIHFRNMLDRLQKMDVITILFDKTTWVEYIRLEIQVDEVIYALRENDICSKILSTL